MFKGSDARYLFTFMLLLENLEKVSSFGKNSNLSLLMEMIEVAFYPDSVTVVASPRSMQNDENIQDFFTTIKTRNSKYLSFLCKEQLKNESSMSESDAVILPFESFEDLSNLIQSVQDAIGKVPKAKPRLVLFQKADFSTTDFSALEGILKQYYVDLRLSVVVEDDKGSLSLYKVRHGTLEFHCDSDARQLCDRGPVSGSTIRVGYDEWYPVFYTKADGEGFGGIMQDVLMIITAKLNITPVYVKNDMPGIWGTIDDNGTWNGMMGQLFRDEVDLLIAGHSPTAARHDVADFTHDVMKINVGLFARQNAGIKLTIQNYLSEFDSTSWLSVFITSLASMATLYLILYNTNRRPKNIDLAVTIVVRALIQKGTQTEPIPRTSWKVATFSVLLFVTLLFAGYRACLNSFLAVVHKPAEIEDLQDVLDKTSGITFWGGGNVELAFSVADPKSVVGQLYTKYLEDPKAQILDYSAALKNVVEDNYVLLGEDRTIMALPEFNCKIFAVPDFVFVKYFLSIPIQMGSKFTNPVKRELLKLINMGVMDRIRDKHFVINVNHETDCAEGQVGPLEYHNVLAPFAVILMGVLGAILISIAELLFKFLHTSLNLDPVHLVHVQEMQEHINKEKLAQMRLLKVSTYLSAKHPQLSYKEKLDGIRRIVND